MAARIVPPSALIGLATTAEHVIASDLPRAIESAARLAPGRDVRVSPLLRETPLRVPHWPTPLPLGAWALAIHLAWTLDIVRGGEANAQELARGGKAAAWLTDLVPDGSTAVVVTHGVFRRFVARSLVNQGWTTAGRISGYGHWSSWTFLAPRWQS